MRTATHTAGDRDVKHTIIAIFACVLMFVTASVAWGAAPTGGAISITQMSNTAYTITIDTAPANIDTLYRCTLAGSDTTFAATLSDTTATSVAVTGVDPLTAITTFLLVRGEDGKTAISDKETFTMYGPEIEYYPINRNDQLAYDRNLHLTEQVIRAVSWRPNSLLSTFTLDGTTGADSSAVYTPWKNNAIVVHATQDGDSVKVKLYTYYGYRTMTQTGATVGYVSSVDSLDINATGVFFKTLTPNIAAPAMYYTLKAYADNGKDTEIQIYLTRDRY